MNSSVLEYKKIWDSIASVIMESKEISKTAFDLWFSDIELESLSSQEAVFSVSSETKQQIISDRYSSLLLSCIKIAIGYEPKVTIILKSDYINRTSVSNSFYDEKVRSTSLINPEYTFSSFIVGESNRFAHSASIAVSENPGFAYNPLMIYGPSGLGKTHLMCAIANHILQKTPSTRIVYVKGDEFSNQLIDAIAKKSTALFREKYRQTDVLMIDDIHFIAGKESTQEEFFHTFNSLYENHKQIIVTSDRPPKDMERLEDRIKSRLESGLLADIGLPDYELRMAILKSKSQIVGLSLTDDVLSFLAENLHSNVRQIEGVVKKLRASQFVSDTPITVYTLKEIIPEFLKETEDTSDMINRIITTTAYHFSVSEQDILGKSRQKEIKNARNVAMYLIKEITQQSLENIGIMFNRDHSTIYSNIQSVKADAAEDHTLEMIIHDITKEIKD